MILVRYILREHVAPFLAAIFVITFLFVIDFFVTLLDSVMNKGLPLRIVLEIFVLNMAWILALSVPMAVLAASLMAFGRLSADQEITAVKAAGVPPLVLMRPVLLFATLLMVLMVIFNNWVLPEANHRAAALMSAVSRKKPHAFIDEGRLLTQFPGVQIWIQQIDPETGVLRGIQIFEHEGSEQPKLVMADSGSIEYRDSGATLLLRLRNGENQMLDRDDPSKFFRIRFQSQDLVVHNVDDRLERDDRTHRGDREMPIEMMLDVVNDAHKAYDEVLEQNAKEIWADMDSLLVGMKGDTLIPKNQPGFADLKLDKGKHRVALFQVSSWERSRQRNVERVGERLESEKKRIAQFWVEIHKKFSIPMACLVFVLVGAPLGIMARRGGIGTGVVFSLFFYIIYWVCLIGGENLADKLTITPFTAMWAPNIVIGLLGIFITWRMTRDNYTGNSLWVRMKTRWRLRREARKAAKLAKVGK